MSKLLVLFPGIGYHCDKPLLFYGRMIAAEAGYKECIKLNYSYEGNIRGDEVKMKQAFSALYEAACNQLENVDFSKYSEVLFISKSIGTIIASEYAKKHNINNVRHILYTPLKYTYMHEPQNAIAFIGDSDPWSEINEIIELSKKADIKLLVYKGVNHSLEGEDALNNIDILKDVMVNTRQFIEDRV